MLIGDFLQEIDKALIGVAGLGRKARDGAANIALAERRALAKKASAEPTAPEPSDAPVDSPPQEFEPESGRTEGNEH